MFLVFRHYRSLSEFFTRSIKEDCREISPECIVSPCDGRVLHLGPVTGETHTEQVKGVTYSLEAFLGPKWIDHSGPYVESLKQKKEGTSLYHCIIYLAPGDYHRFHSPAVWKPVLRRHFYGELLSVSPKVANWVPGLFALNERAAYIGEWEHGFFSYTAVGKCLTIWRARADKKFQKICFFKNRKFFSTSIVRCSNERSVMLAHVDPQNIRDKKFQGADERFILMCLHACVTE